MLLKQKRDLPITVETIQYISDEIALDMDVFRPNEGDFPGQRPGVLFFFGGGFRVGCKEAFEPQAMELAKQGYVCFCPSYRIRELHGTSPRESILDGAAAWLFIRENAYRWNLDRDRMAISGGSAGGLIATMCGPLSGIEPQALVLFNPAIMPSKGEAVSGTSIEISEINGVTRTAPDAIDPNMPKTLIMHGEQDPIVPIGRIRRFVEMAQETGISARLISYENMGHGFFNFNRSRAHYFMTLGQMLLFLDQTIGDDLTMQGNNVPDL